MLLGKNSLTERSSQILWAVPISPSANAAECSVCACIIHCSMSALFRGAPRAPAASKPLISAFSAPFQPKSWQPEGRKARAEWTQSDFGCQGRAAGLGRCWGQLLAAVTVKACSPGTAAAGLEHSKRGDVAWGAAWWMKMSINDAPARLAFMNSFPWRLGRLQAWLWSALSELFLLGGFLSWSCLVIKIKKKNSRSEQKSQYRWWAPQKDLGNHRIFWHKDPRVPFGAEKTSFGVLIYWFITCFSFWPESSSRKGFWAESFLVTTYFCWFRLKMHSLSCWKVLLTHHVPRVVPPPHPGLAHLRVTPGIKTDPAQHSLPSPNHSSLFAKSLT